MNLLTADASPSAKKVQRRSTRRADRVREVILDVAFDSFSASGFGGTSTRAIAKLAGVQHSLLLYHFESKEKLWIAMMDKMLGRHVQYLTEVLEGAKDQSPSDQLRLYIQAYAKTLGASPHLFRIMIQQSTQNSDRIKWLLDNHLREKFSLITDIIARAQAEGRVIPGEPAHVFYLIVGGAGIFYTSSREYSLLTGKDPASAAEMHKLTDFLCSVIFKEKQ